MSPRIPKLNIKGLKYWKNKGKYGKDVMLYFHDDMDGIFSAVVIKKRLQKLGYIIKGYGVLNYNQSWKYTTLDPKMINVVVDFANMPDTERKDLIDVYIDHHGEFDIDEKEFYKNGPIIKTKTPSAYEGICNVIGEPTDEILLYSIDMIDSAKYDDYLVSWKDILNFDWNLFKEISNKEGKVTIKPFKESKSVTFGYSIIAKLTFAGAFNQYIKRGDHKTLIEVVHNLENVSIYNIFRVMKKLYPGNNVWTSGRSKGKGKNFTEDGNWRITTMQKKTRGETYSKKIYNSQVDFYNDTQMNLSKKGYQVLGKLMFVPSGTWANALRARSILQTDYDNNVVPKSHKIDFIALQYGNTIQVCSYNKMDQNKNLPILKDGSVLNDLGSYMNSLLSNFQKYFGYYDKETSVGQDELTVSGGHIGIGTISNIIGSVDTKKIEERGGTVTKLIEKYNGYRYIDLIKNKMINDLSGIDWKVGISWGLESENDLSSMIREIIKRDDKLQLKISTYVSDNISNWSVVGEKEKLEKDIKLIIKSEIELLSKKNITDWYDRCMMDHKVVLISDIRIIDQKGDVI